MSTWCFLERRGAGAAPPPALDNQTICMCISPRTECDGAPQLFVDCWFADLCSRIVCCVGCAGLRPLFCVVAHQSRLFSPQQDTRLTIQRILAGMDARTRDSGRLLTCDWGQMGRGASICGRVHLCVSISASQLCFVQISSIE
jgi:hypothetical protein